MTAAPATLPRVTALLPCYNAAGFIERTLDSLAAQTWPDLEILVGDDCSPDETLAIVQRFARDHPNVRILERASNLGWLRNSNDLMAQAQGALMFFAFHDDIVDPTYVERLVAALDADPDAIIAFSDLELVEVDGGRSIHRFEAMQGLRSALHRGLVFGSHPGDWWVPNRGLFRAEAFHRIGGIKPNRLGEYSADWPWLLHMALLGGFVRVPEILCHKFYQPRSLSKTWPTDPRRGRALRHAGVREVWHSHLPLAVRALLAAWIAVTPLRLLRRIARRLRARAAP